MRLRGVMSEKKANVLTAACLACLLFGFAFCIVSGAIHSQAVSDAKGWLGPTVGGIAYSLWICAEPGDTRRDVYFAAGFGATAGWVETGVINSILGVSGLLLILVARGIENQLNDNAAIDAI